MTQDDDLEELIVVDDNEDDLVRITDDDPEVHNSFPVRNNGYGSMPPPPPPLPRPRPNLSPVSNVIPTVEPGVQPNTSSDTNSHPVPSPNVNPILGSLTERTTRSSTNPYSTRGASHAKPKKLKLKLSEKASAQAPTASFLGSYDRELDSDADDEGNELLFEEHFILRMPHGDDCDRLRKMVSNRDVSNDVWFKFKDSRRATFHIGNSAYSAKLVDLPCVIESQKTFDNKHMFKVADISQMLAVEEKIYPTSEATQHRNFNIEEFIWPHGITPPLRWVRKRRFRKRVNKRTIETVEQEVERLLSEDALATSVKYEVLENVNPDLSDSEFLERDGGPAEDLDAPTPLPLDSELGDAPTPMAGGEDDLGEGSEDEDGDDGDGDDGEGDIDEELAAELDLALGSQSEEGDTDGEDPSEDDDDDDEEEEEEDDDDGYDDGEDKRARKLLNEEIRDLEAAVAKKSTEIERSLNPLIKRRFEDALRKLRTDLDLKLAQRTQLDEQRQNRRQKSNEVGAADPDGDVEVDIDPDQEVDGDAGMNAVAVVVNSDDGPAGVSLSLASGHVIRSGSPHKSDPVTVIGNLPVNVANGAGVGVEIGMVMGQTMDEQGDDDDAMDDLDDLFGAPVPEQPHPG